LPSVKKERPRRVAAQIVIVSTQGGTAWLNNLIRIREKSYPSRISRTWV
jgi:hypothetical protein